MYLTCILWRLLLILHGDGDKCCLYDLTLIVMNVFEEIQKHFEFSIFSQHWNNAGNWNSCSWRTKTLLPSRVNIVAAAVLVSQGARASAAMLLTYSVGIFQFQHYKGLILMHKIIWRVWIANENCDSCHPFPPPPQKKKKKREKKKIPVVSEWCILCCSLYYLSVAVVLGAVTLLCEIKQVAIYQENYMHIW